MNCPLHRRGRERHPLLMELHEPPHMRLPVMPVQCFDLFRPVLLDPRGTYPVLQQMKLRSLIRINVGPSGVRLYLGLAHGANDAARQALDPALGFAGRRLGHQLHNLVGFAIAGRLSQGDHLTDPERV